MYKVLIVDDEYDIRTNLARFLPWGRHDFLVAGQAATGSEAKEFIETHHIDVVFCDIRMPRMSGIEFARWARDTGKSFIIVFLSAHRKFEFAQEALRLGVRRYLVKPPDLEEFVATIAALKKELDERKLDAQETSTAPAGDPTLETVRAYIAGDPAAASIAGAARLLSMSSHYLSTCFKQKTGETFSSVLLRTKMERAAHLIRESAYSTAEISRIVGYANPKNFTRAFGSYFGKPPREFRRDSSNPKGIGV